MVLREGMMDVCAIRRGGMERSSRQRTTEYLLQVVAVGELRRARMYSGRYIDKGRPNDDN